MRIKSLAALRAPGALKIVAFFALLLLAMLWVSTQTYQIRDVGMVRTDPGVWSGDEPHYLIMVNSLLFDGDLLLAQNYANARTVGWDAGWRWRGKPFAPHTILVDPNTREHALWLDACAINRLARCWPKNRTMTPDLIDKHFPYLPTTIERGAHPVAFPSIIAAVLAPTRPAIEDVEYRIAVFMGFIGWLGAVLTYLTVRELHPSVRLAIMASLLLALASPWLAYTRSFYPASIAGVALIFSLWAILRERVVLAALAVSLAAAVKPALSLVAICWFLFQVLNRRWRHAAIFAGCVGSCGLALGGINYWMTGTPLVFGAITPATFFKFDAAIFRSLLDPQYGLLLFAPWTVVAFIYLCRPRLFARQSDIDPMSWLAISLFPILVLLSSFAAVGDLCYGPRYWVPFLPWLAVAAAAAIGAAGRLQRFGILLLAVVGAFVAIPGALLYPSVWDRAPHVALEILVQEIWQ